jgi:hypothetical protein
MSDPFDVLRGPDPSVPLDPTFADAVMGAVRTRLDVAADVRPPVDANRTDELEIVPMHNDKPSSPRWIYLAAAMVLLAVVGVAVLLARGNSSTDPATSSTTPSTSAPPDPSIAVPASLQARWMGDHRAVGSSSVGVTVLFTADSFTVAQANTVTVPLLRGTAVKSGVDQLVLTSDGSGTYCTSGQTGRYRWALSTSGRTLTLTSVVDPCVERVAAVEGTFWSTHCIEPGAFCLGELDAGGHSSQYMAPLLPTGATWRPVVGGVTYDVPDGWANWWDWGDRFGLGLESDYASTTPDDIEPAKSLYVVSPGNGAVDDVPCSAGAPDLTGTVADTVSELRALPGLIVSASTPITVAGLDGQWVDLTVDPTTTLVPCNGEQMVVYLHPNDNMTQRLAPGQRHRLMLLNVDGGSSRHLVAVTIAVRDAADFDAWVAQAMPVVQSLQFSS